MGDALLQKTYTVDFLNKKRVLNDGIVPQYYVENSHEAIIPKEIFMRVQVEKLRRANMTSGKGKKRVYSSKYALSSIVYCSKCGDIYRRIKWNNRGLKYTVWRCCTRVENGPKACDADTIKEIVLHQVTIDAINRLIEEKTDLKEIINKNIEKVISKDPEGKIEEIDREMLSVQKELLKIANAKGNYDHLTKRVEELREEKQRVLLEVAEEQGIQNRLREMKSFLMEQDLLLSDYDEDLVRKLIEKIIVYDDEFKVIFKSGLEVEIEK